MTVPGATGDAGGAPVAGEVRWGLGDAALGFVLGFLGAAVLANIWVAATGDGTDGNPEFPLGLMFFSILGLWLAYLGVIVRASYRKGSRSLRRDFGLEVKGPDVWLGFGGAIAGQVLAVVLVAIVQALFPSVDAGEPAERALGNSSALVTACRVVLVVVGAPIVEELFFRGLVLRAIARRLGDVWAVVLSAAVFGLVHVQGPQLPALVAFGLVLGYLAVRTGRLGPSIVAHMAFNGLSTAVVLASR